MHLTGHLVTQGSRLPRVGAARERPCLRHLVQRSPELEVRVLASGGQVFIVGFLTAAREG